MSTLTPQTATGATLSGWLEQLLHFYTRDLEALADAHIYESIGGVARTAHDFSTEIAMMMDWTVAMLNGGDTSFPGEEVHAKLMETTKTKAELVALVQAAGARLKEALLQVSQERLDTVIEAPFGMTMPASALANIFVNHVWYHDGQLNLIQAYHGDKEMHWM